MVAQKTKSILLKVDLFFLLPGEKKNKKLMILSSNATLAWKKTFKPEFLVLFYEVFFLET